jgi:hypothetical protein
MTDDFLIPSFKQTHFMKTFCLTSMIAFCLLLCINGLQAQTVYVTAHGKNYHQKDCQYLKGASSTAMGLADAKEKGYSACSVCFAENNAKAGVRKESVRVGEVNNVKGEAKKGADKIGSVKTASKVDFKKGAETLPEEKVQKRSR